MHRPRSPLPNWCFTARRSACWRSGASSPFAIAGCWRRLPRPMRRPISGVDCRVSPRWCCSSTRWGGCRSPLRSPSTTLRRCFLPPWLPALAGLVSGMLAAVAYVNVKQLGRLGEPEWRVVFYFTLLSTAGGAGWMALAGFHRPQPGDWPWLVGIGVTATVAQLALTRAYHRGRTLTVGSLAYATVGFSALYGVLLFGERLPTLAWIGMAVVAAAGVWAVRASAPVRSDSL